MVLIFIFTSVFNHGQRILFSNSLILAAISMALASLKAVIMPNSIPIHAALDGNNQGEMSNALDHIGCNTKHHGNPADVLVLVGDQERPVHYKASAVHMSGSNKEAAITKSKWQPPRRNEYIPDGLSMSFQPAFAAGNELWKAHFPLNAIKTFVNYHLPTQYICTDQPMQKAVRFQSTPLPDYTNVSKTPPQNFTAMLQILLEFDLRSVHI